MQHTSGMTDEPTRWVRGSEDWGWGPPRRGIRSGQQGPMQSDKVHKGTLHAVEKGGETSACGKAMGYVSGHRWPVGMARTSDICQDCVKATS